MSWHLYSRARGLIVSGVLILVLIVITMGFALNRQDNGMNRDLSIMTCNIGDIMGGNPLESDQVAVYLESCGVPDVLLLQEVRGKKEAAWLARQLDLPYFVFLNDAHADHMGIAILSALPLLNHDQLYFKSSLRGAGAIAAEVDINGSRLLLVNVHLDRATFVPIGHNVVPVTPDLMIEFLKKEIWGDSVRSRSVEELMDWLDRKNPAHAVLGGDFNTIPFFLFVSGSLERKNARVVLLSPGDHFPVRADIVLPDQG